ncbi:MAG: thiamine phosphate synthase [Acidobacteria bacterium]|nr:thiamine phosphate synthase [Acidobacteriota bacterium]
MNPLPKLYAIVDVSSFPSAELLFRAAEELVAAGARIVQYRNKSDDPRSMLADARELRRRIGARASLIMNDRADLCVAADFDGVHLGQDDLSPESARKILGRGRILGISTHNPEQVKRADETSADYIAIGPVFETSTKASPDPVVGLSGVRRARELTAKPLVAIGGIHRENCRPVIEAGADSVAVISGLVVEPGKSVEEFLRILG